MCTFSEYQVVKSNHMFYTRVKVSTVVFLWAINFTNTAGKQIVLL
jgi:hypothetical protein